MTYLPFFRSPVTIVGAATVLLLPLLCFPVAAEQPERPGPDAARAAGFAALKAAQSDPDRIVEAAKQLAAAADGYVAAGKQAQAQEMESYLYWCKKKMTSEQMDAFLAQEGAAAKKVVAKLEEVAARKVDAAQAQEWLDKADQWAKAHPDNQFLVAVHYFEVASRFKGTQPGMAALDKSLGAFQESKVAAPKSATDAPTTVDEGPKDGPATRRAPVPAPEALKESEKLVRDIFKADYAKTAPGDKLALSQKLLQQGNETTDDPKARYVLFREARDMAAQAGDADTIVRAVDEMAKFFAVDVLEEKAAALAKAVGGAKTPEAAAKLAETLLATVDAAIAADKYDAAQRLAAVAAAVAPRTQNAPLATRAKARLQEIQALANEAEAIKVARKTLTDKRGDPAANLAVGKFLCFSKGDWETGLPMLAKGSDASMKTLAQRDHANPKDAAEQVAVGDDWWELAEKLTGAQKTQIQRHALKWYEAALPQLVGITKAKVTQRMEFAKAPPPQSPSLVLGGPLGKTKRTETVGGGGGGEYEGIPEKLALLRGLRVATQNFAGHLVIKSVIPLYLTATGQVEGKQCGSGHEPWKELVAKPGYAVGALVGKGGLRVDGFWLVFMRITPTGLDPHDKYESDWVGGRGGGGEQQIGGSGALVIGVFGRCGAEMDAIGLVLKE